MQEDEVRVSNGKLCINGMKQDEPFTTVDANYEFWPVLVPDGSLLVLGIIVIIVWIDIYGYGDFFQTF